MNASVAFVVIALALLACGCAIYFLWKSLAALLLVQAFENRSQSNEIDEQIQNYVTQLEDLSFDYQEGKLSLEDFEESKKLLVSAMARLMQERDRDLGPYREQARKLLDQALTGVVLSISLTLGLAAPLHAQDPAVLERFFGDPQQPVKVGEAPDVPSGTISFVVQDEKGTLSNQQVRVGSLSKDGARKEYFCTTDAAGQCTIAKLPTGEQEAYRATLHVAGTTYASTPFRLSATRGVRAEIEVYPTTQDSRYVLQAFGALFFEYENNKAHVSQHTELVNMSDRMFVLPNEGMTFSIPDHASSFALEPGMHTLSAQIKGDSVVITGNLPPGRTPLDWRFDLPKRDVGKLDFRFPFSTLEYYIATDFAPGVTLDVAGFPPAAQEEREDRVLLSTRRWSHPGANDTYDLEIQIRGLAAHAPLRWSAFAIACALLAIGVALTARKAQRDPDKDFEAQQAQIVENARELHRQKQNNEIGPEYFAEQRDRLIDELAALLSEKCEINQG